MLIEGFKAFEKGLICRKHQYQLGLNEYVGKIDKMSTGFHFGKTVEDASEFYDISNLNYVWHKVIGEVEKEETNMVTNKLIILEEINIREYQINKLLTTFKKLNEQFFENKAILVGSLSLAIEGFLPHRLPIDLDIILPHFMIPTDGRSISLFKPNEYQNILAQFYDGKVKVDIFVDPRRQYFVKDGIKIGDIHSTFMAKLSIHKLEDGSKHWIDVYEYMKWKETQKKDSSNKNKHSIEELIINLD